MFSLNSARKLALPVLSLTAAFAFTACSKDDDTAATTPPTTESQFVVTMAVQGSNNAFTYYSVPFSDVMNGTVSPQGKGIEQPGYFDFTQIDNTIYSIGGLNDVAVVGIAKNEKGELTKIGNTSFQTSISDIVKADANTLVAVEMKHPSTVVKFHTINANTVSVTSTKQHPISDLSPLSAPSYSGMRVVGNQLFLSYYISDPTTFNTPSTDSAMIAVYSYPELQFQKIISDKRTGPVGSFHGKNGLIQDEQGNIFALSNSNPANGYSQSTKKGGILKINSGSTTFDQNYFFDVEAATGGTNIAHLKCLGNGKALAEVNMQANASQTKWSDSPLKTAILDLNTKTLDFVSGMPQHNGIGRRLAALQDGTFVYMAIPENNKVYDYKIDIQSKTATKGAEVEANFVAGFSKL